MTTKTYTYTIYRPGREPERGNVEWPKNYAYCDIEIFGRCIIHCREIAFISAGRDEEGLTMITDAFQPLVGDPDDDEITESLERHHNYSLWDLWDDVKDFAHGKYPRNEAATAIYHEWLRAKGHATDEAAIVGTVIVFDEPIWH